MPVNYDRTDGGYKLPAITDPERICIQLEIPNDPDHKAAFWGALWSLTWYNAWQKDPDKRGKDVAAVWKDVWFKARAANQDWDACLNCDDENGCVEYTPQYIQEWYPNNPYISVPDGLVKKWYLAPEINLLGVPAGTVVTDILNTAPGDEGDFIRCRLTFSGVGTVEIHWHTVHFGGLAQVQVDSLLTKIYYVELSTDIAATPPEPPTNLITEYEFDVPGTHHIDITMIPQIKADLEALGYGGGIVKIVMCGFDQMIITPQFRFTAECGLEQSNDSGATWQAVPGWDTFAPACFTGPQGPAGATGPQGATGPAGPAGADGQDCDCDSWDDEGDIPTPEGTAGDEKRCEVAARTVNSILDRLYIPWLNDAAFAFYEQGLSNADLASQIENWLWTGGVDAFQTSGAEGIVQWFSWQVVVTSPLLVSGASAVGYGRIVALLNAQSAIDIIAVRDAVDGFLGRQALICALYNNLNEDGDIDAATYVLWKSAIENLTPTELSSAARDDFLLFLDKMIPLSSVRLAARDQEADTSFNCEFCEAEEPEEPVHEWSATFDFRISDYDFVTEAQGSTVPSQTGQYLSGIGWKSMYAASGGLEVITLKISRAVSLSGVTGIRLLSTRQAASGASTPYVYLGAGGGSAYWNFPNNSHGMRYDLVLGGAFGSGILYEDTSGIETSSGLDWDGSEAYTVLHQIKLYGTGTRPAGLAGIPD